MGLYDFTQPPGPLGATWRLLYLCYRAALLESNSPVFRLGAKRLLVLALLAVALPLLALWNGLGFLLDDLFFPAYQRQEIVAPIFIQGSARSGTTALHRLMASDPELTAMSTWEIFLAPSVAWRRLFWGIGALDRRLLRGGLARAVGAFAEWLAGVTAVVHEVQLFGAEEDEWLMLHIGAAQLLAFFFPVLEDMAPVVSWSLPEATQRAILDYYTGCVRRHLYAHGGKKAYVAKNPTFNRRMAWLQKAFPDARFVVMARAPEETVPSIVSYIASVWAVFCSPRARFPLARELTELQPGDIALPIDALLDWPEGQRAVVANRALRQDGAKALRELYGKLKMQQSLEFAEKAREAAGRAPPSRAVHRYAVEDTGMSKEEFRAFFAEATARLERLEQGQWR